MMRIRVKKTRFFKRFEAEKKADGKKRKTFQESWLTKRKNGKKKAERKKKRRPRSSS